MDPAREPGADTLSVGINKCKERFSIFQTLLSSYWTVEELHGQRCGDESGWDWESKVKMRHKKYDYLLHQVDQEQ